MLSRFPFTIWSTVVETETACNPNPFITPEVMEDLKSGNVKHVPWMTGVVQNEGLLVAASMLTAHSEKDNLNQGFNETMIKLLGLESFEPKTQETYRKIFDFYLHHDDLDVQDAQQVKGFIDVAPWALPNNTIQLLATKAQGMIVNCNNENTYTLVNCLRNISVAVLLQSQDAFKIFHRFPFTIWSTVVETETACNPNPFITPEVMEDLKSGNVKHVPWMTGVVQNEGLLVAASMLTAHSEKDNLNQGFNETMIKLLGLESFEPKTQETYRKIFDFYLHHDDLDVQDAQQVKGFIDVWSDRYFVYPLYKALRLQLSNGHNSIYLYNFEYSGEYTYATPFSTQSQSYSYHLGPSHCDDLLYQYATPDLFNNLSQPTDLALSNIWLGLWTNFAIYGFPFTIWSSVVETETACNPNPFITPEVMEDLKSGNVKHVPWMTGVVQNDGLLVAASMLTAHSEKDDLNQGFNKTMIKLLGLESFEPKTQETYRKIFDFYLHHDDLDVQDAQQVKGFIDVWSDRYFVYPLYKALRLQLSNGHNSIYLYNFEYSGEYTYAAPFSTQSQSYSYHLGPSHCDDLLYQYGTPGLFNNLSQPTDLALSNIWLGLEPNPAENKILNISWDPLPTGDLHIGDTLFLNVTGSTYTGVHFSIWQGFYEERIALWEQIESAMREGILRRMM
ncbi:hypothetical protein HUJ04_010857 [Dendroctonus ponderosae]|nr:hypothetical protein HUJ04_010857 [Dendroctonus ponderosae]